MPVERCARWPGLEVEAAVGRFAEGTGAARQSHRGIVPLGRLGRPVEVVEQGAELGEPCSAGVLRPFDLGDGVADDADCGGAPRRESEIQLVIEPCVCGVLCQATTR